MVAKDPIFSDSHERPLMAVFRHPNQRALAVTEGAALIRHWWMLPPAEDVKEHASMVVDRRTNPSVRGRYFTKSAVRHLAWVGCRRILKGVDIRTRDVSNFILEAIARDYGTRRVDVVAVDDGDGFLEMVLVDVFTTTTPGGQEQT